MAQIGKITPAYHEGEPVREWRVPVQVFMMPSARELVVRSIYEDEGVFCIDVEEKDE